MTSIQAIRIVGGVMPPSLIAHLHDGTLGSADSRSPASYHLVGSESVRDAAARAWSYLRGAWTTWQESESGRVDGAGTGPARDRWLLPLLRELGYGQVPTNPHGIVIDGTAYPMSHLWQHVPVHLLGPGVHLDKRNPGVTGAARAPQAMVQELLNRSEGHLWAILSNGYRLRLLRDSTALVGSAYVEFDLDAIFAGELYAEWLILFQLAHVSRVEVRSEEQGPASCWLEVWRGAATDAGARALGRLESGVEKALEALGSGFLAHRSNAWLVDALRSGDTTRHDYHRALLRLIYRLLFTFVAEDRGLLLDPESSSTAKERYAAYFSTARLRHLSRVRAGGPHADLWRAQRLVLKALGTEGLVEIGIPALGGVFAADDRLRPPLVAPDADDLLWGADIANADLLAAITQLAWIVAPNGRTQPIDYRHLGAEELGSVYEALLELDPAVDLDERTFSITRVMGSERKTTGSYYTSPDLVSALLDTALDPVIQRAAPLGADPAEAERALLSLTICDPACGSGGFLVAAARRIAQRLAEVRAGDDSPTPDSVHHAMRDVVGRCIYGVDINDLAAEVAKVALWLEALEPGKPLTFLDARIRTGNALMGTTPALVEAGVPDDAFKELAGDDKKVASEIRKRNKGESAGQDLLFGGTVIDLAKLAEQRRDLLVNADSMDEVEAQRTRWEELQQSKVLRGHRLQADAWCAAFVWPLESGMPLPPTSAVVRSIATQQGSYPDTIATVNALAHQYRFFHWHLEFPEVFLGQGATGDQGWAGGFTCVLGNPPWEHVELKEQEFFASRDPEIAEAAGAKRKKLIAALASSDPALDKAYRETKREIDGLRHFAASGRFPLTGRGRIKTDPIFAELFRMLTAPEGRTGIIVPTGIATDATTQYFFKDLVQSKTLAALYDFENAKPLFEGVHRSFKFCLLTMTGRRETADAAWFAFFLHDPSEITEKRFRLTPEEITLLNPNTGTCPVFRTRRDAEITLGIYRRVPVLIKEGDPDGNPWGISFMQGLFNMTSDSHLFHTREELEADGWTLKGNVFERPLGTGGGASLMLPLYEAKMIHHYDARWATYEPDGSTRLMTEAEKSRREPPIPRYWVAASEVDRKLDAGVLALPAFRNIARSTDERTMITAVLPRVGVGHSAPIALSPRPRSLQAAFTSFALDYALRQKLGGTNLTFNYVMQLPIPAPQAEVPGLPLDRRSPSWVELRVDRLNAWISHEVERSQVRAELDAYYFHLYGIERKDVDYIMDTFPIVKRKDEAEFGDYRTKALILAAYDAMTTAILTGETYESPFTEVPA